MEVRKNDAAKVAAFKAQNVVRVPSAEGEFAPKRVQDAAARVAREQIERRMKEGTPGLDDVVRIMCEATSYFIQEEYAREALDALAARGYRIVRVSS